MYPINWSLGPGEELRDGSSGFSVQEAWWSNGKVRDGDRHIVFSLAVTQDISRATSWVIHTCMFEKPWLTGFRRWAALTKPLKKVAGKRSRATESQATGSRMDWGLRGSWWARSWTGERREMSRGWRNTKVSEAWEGKLREGACGRSSQFQTSYPLLWVRRCWKARKAIWNFVRKSAFTVLPIPLHPSVPEWCPGNLLCFPQGIMDRNHQECPVVIRVSSFNKGLVQIHIILFLKNPFWTPNFTHIMFVHPHSLPCEVLR